MVKTLRITTFLIAIMVLGFIVFIASKGIASDKDIEELLTAPGIAAQLQTGSGINKNSNIEEDSPLIRQAKEFALRINPPPPPPPPERAEPVPQEAPRPQASVAAKFTLVGTSCQGGSEDKSWALINEVGKGWHWVKQGGKVGYLIIEGIGDGIVLIRDGSSTYELTAEREQKPDYVKSFTGSIISEKTVPVWKTKEAQKAVDAQTAPSTSPESVQPDVSTAENTVSVKTTKEQLQENMEWIKQLKENPDALGMTAEEAKEIGDFGDMLKTLETELDVEPNQSTMANETNSVENKDINEQKPAPEIKQQSEPNKVNPSPARRFKRSRR